MDLRQFPLSADNAIVVCLVEENSLAESQLCRTLRPDRRIRVVPFREILDPSVHRKGITIIVLDRGTLSSPFPQFLRRLRRRVGHAKAIILNRDCQDAELIEMLALGVDGFLAYRDVGQKLRLAIHTVAEDRLWIPADVIEQFVRQSLPAWRPRALPNGDLTGRERQILELVAQKLQNKEIAGKLGISQSTVKFHLANIFAKLGVRERFSAVEAAGSAGAAFAVAKQNGVAGRG